MKFARDLGEIKLVEDVVLVWHLLFYGIFLYIIRLTL